jgi:hypothetical protein
MSSTSVFVQAIEVDVAGEVLAVLPRPSDLAAPGCSIAPADAE